jgi:hypothetical protein
MIICKKFYALLLQRIVPGSLRVLLKPHITEIFSVNLYHRTR